MLGEQSRRTEPRRAKRRRLIMKGLASRKGVGMVLELCQSWEIEKNTAAKMEGDERGKNCYARTRKVSNAIFLTKYRCFAAVGEGKREL